MERIIKKNIYEHTKHIVISFASIPEFVNSLRFCIIRWPRYDAAQNSAPISLRPKVDMCVGASKSVGHTL